MNSPPSLVLLKGKSRASCFNQQLAPIALLHSVESSGLPLLQHQRVSNTDVMALQIVPDLPSAYKRAPAAGPASHE